jgi:putative nucleotidyltransferase with HDIG domain
MASLKKGFLGFPILKKSIKSFFLFLFAIVLSVITILYGTEKSGNEIFGTIIISLSCYLVLFFYLFQFRSGVLQMPYKVMFILSAIVSFLMITKVVALTSNDRFIFIIPVAIIPVVIRTFFDARTALFALIVELMLSGLIIIDPYWFIMMNFIVGMVSIFALDHIYRKTRILFTSVIVILDYWLVYTGISLVFDPESLYLSDFSIFAINGALLILCYPLISLFEKYFLMISDATLLSLSDKTQPLLRKLADEAPGSFHHSMQVANLAEEAAREIGANTMLVRTGALYHDIGKIASSKYFTENQTDNNSPHNELDPQESASIIIGHVKKGVILGKNYKLPQEVIDFISTHHGTSVAYFFYKKYMDKYGQKPEEKDFTYPGPKPFSKETALVMMADSVEAASRSLTDFSETSIDNLVEKILFMQEQDGQYSEVPLTYKDMSDIKSVFKRMLSNMYHVRVVYPERS